MFKIFKPALFALAILLAACAPQGTPTLSSADVAGTAVAEAWIRVTQTAAAIPTATPTEPPSPTPLPPPATFTPLAPPTLDIALLPSPTSTSSGDECWKPLVVSSNAKMTRLRLQNETKGPVILTIYLHKTPFGDCGYTGYNIGKGERVFIDYPQGCYDFSAFLNDPKNPGKSFGGGAGTCANNSDLWVVKIGKDIINLVSP
jgi:hypothetical protein